MTASLGGMVQWGIDDGRSVMDSRGVEVWSGVMVALPTDLARAMRISALKMDHRLIEVTALEVRA
jgi:hypothetical protein